MQNTNKIIINSGVMYARVAITMVVSLLSSRWILMALGKEDFGLYSLIAGMLTLLMFVNLSMASSTQRFLSYYQTKDKGSQVKEVFYISLILHFLVGVIVLLLIETVGLLLLDHFLQIPFGKEQLALFVLHTLSISTFFLIISVPYHACLIAHENMIFISIVQILHAFLKLSAAIILLYYDGSRLKLYAILLLTFQIIETIIYGLYGKRKYAETSVTFHRISDFSLMKEIISYASYNMIGALSTLFRTQGVSLLFNSFYGVIINAAYGIASQVQGQMRFFSGTIVNAARPQIVKKEGEGNRKGMLALTNSTCKLSFLMLATFAIPLIVEMPYVLRLWLKNVPEYTAGLTSLMLILSMISQFNVGTIIGIESVGNIKMVQLTVSILHFIVLPLAWLLLYFDFSPYWVLLMIIFEEAIALLIAILVSNKITGLDIKDFLFNYLIPSIATFIVVFFICKAVSLFLSEGFTRLIIVSFTSVFASIILCMSYSLNKQERQRITFFISMLKDKIQF